MYCYYYYYDIMPILVEINYIKARDLTKDMSHEGRLSVSYYLLYWVYVHRKLAAFSIHVQVLLLYITTLCHNFCPLIMKALLFLLLFTYVIPILGEIIH